LPTIKGDIALILSSRDILDL